MEEATAGGVKVSGVSHIGPGEMEVVMQKEFHGSVSVGKVANAEVTEEDIAIAVDGVMEAQLDG